MTASASPLTISSCPQHSLHRRHGQIAFEFGWIGGRNNCGVARRGRVVAVVEAVLDSGRSNGNNVGADFEVPFPTDYSELLEQAKEATESALKDEKQLMEIEFPTSGLGSVPGDGEGGTEMTGSMQLIREFCDRFVTPEKMTRTRIFFPEASEVKVARKSAFEGVSFKLDYLTKPSFFQDLGFFTKVKMSDRVKPEDELFLVAYPYFNVDEMLVVEELYKEAVTNTGRKLIIFNGELDRIRSGCILFACNHDAPHKTIFPTLYISATLLPEFGRISLHKSQLFIYFASPTTLLSLKAELDYPPFFYPKLEALSQNLFPKMETVYYIHDFKGQNGGTLFRCYPGPWKVLRKFGNKRTCIHQQDTMPSLKEVALNILPSS